MNNDEVHRLIERLKSAKLKRMRRSSIQDKNKNNLTNIRQEKFRPTGFKFYKKDFSGINRKRIEFDTAGFFNEHDC